MGTSRMNDEHGCSVCTAGNENHEKFRTRLGRKLVTRYQYDYRHTDGELFSTVATSLRECRERRDKWLEQKTINKG